MILHNMQQEVLPAESVIRQESNYYTVSRSLGIASHSLIDIRQMQGGVSCIYLHNTHYFFSHGTTGAKMNYIAVR